MHLVSLESTQEARVAQQLLRFSRALQKHIFPKGPSVESFIEQNDILSPSQYGFRKAHSTQRAILDIVSTT